VKKLLAIAFFLLLGFSTVRATGSLVLVAGNESDNVVQFDLTTGQWSEIARLPKGAHPRGITIGNSGEIFLGLSGGKKNIVRLTSTNGSMQMKDVTVSIGRYGPGLIVFGNGRIWAAGDTDRVILNINPETGEVLSPSQYKNSFNLVGLAANGNELYAAQYFQRSILRYDLRSENIDAVLLINKDPHLNRPIGMTIGHNGNLYVANGLEPTVVEFDIKTGTYIRTLVDLGAAGKEGINGIVYASDVQRY